MTTYAKIIPMRAALAEEFGLSLACRKLSCTEQDLEKVLGRFVRGKNKGKLRGFIHWNKCTSGGWFRPAHSNGFVLQPNERFGYCLREGFDFASKEVTVHQIASKRRLDETLATLAILFPDHTDLHHMIAYFILSDGMTAVAARNHCLEILNKKRED